MQMKARQCAIISAVLRRLERMEKAIDNGNFEGALGYKVVVEVEIIFNKPGCCIKRPKKKES